MKQAISVLSLGTAIVLGMSFIVLVVPWFKPPPEAVATTDTRWEEVRAASDRPLYCEGDWTDLQMASDAYQANAELDELLNTQVVDVDALQAAGAEELASLERWYAERGGYPGIDFTRPGHLSSLALAKLALFASEDQELGHRIAWLLASRSVECGGVLDATVGSLVVEAIDRMGTVYGPNAEERISFTSSALAAAIVREHVYVGDSYIPWMRAGNEPEGLVFGNDPVEHAIASGPLFSWNREARMYRWYFSHHDAEILETTSFDELANVVGVKGVDSLPHSLVVRAASMDLSAVVMAFEERIASAGLTGLESQAD